jgi:hypothetical protein
MKMPTAPLPVQPHAGLDAPAGRRRARAVWNTVVLLDLGGYGISLQGAECRAPTAGGSA